MGVVAVDVLRIGIAGGEMMGIAVVDAPFRGRLRGISGASIDAKTAA